jgi:hypothetical protein
MRSTIDAIRYLERAVLDFGGIALRYGGFYGPGTGLARGGEQLEMIRKRRFPLVGDGRAVWSLVHVDDAAAATVAALQRAKPDTIYNIVDDEPARVREVLSYLAQVIGAKPPWRIPLWLARLLGEHMIVMMDEVRGASNAACRARERRRGSCQATATDALTFLPPRPAPSAHPRDLRDQADGRRLPENGRAPAARAPRGSSSHCGWRLADGVSPARRGRAGSARRSRASRTSWSRSGRTGLLR